METRMKMGFFGPRRFGQLLLRDLTGGYRSMLIAMAAVAGVILICSALSMLGDLYGTRQTYSPLGYHFGFFAGLLFVGGYVVTSLTFREARQTGSSGFYLTLPASLFEKLASKLLATSVGYALGAVLFCTAVSAASEGINTLIFGRSHAIFDPFEPAVWQAVGIYLITQSVVLLGSIWFRRLALVKTVLWSSLAGIAVVVVLIVAGRLILADHGSWMPTSKTGFSRVVWGLNWNDAFVTNHFGPGSKGYPGMLAFKTTLQVMFYAMAPVSWLAAYYRLKEVEA
jgi:hypothetical protein